MIRLRKPLDYYKEKYGTYAYALNKLYCLWRSSITAARKVPGSESLRLMRWRIGICVPRKSYGLGRHSGDFRQYPPQVDKALLADPSPSEVERDIPFIGEIYMGHLRYSTTGKSGMNYVHPFLRRNNWRSRNLLMCGNFNMTNVDEIFETVVSRGQHPRLYSDGIVLLEQLGWLSTARITAYTANIATRSGSLSCPMPSRSASI